MPKIAVSAITLAKDGRMTASAPLSMCGDFDGSQATVGLDGERQRLPTRPGPKHSGQSFPGLWVAPGTGLGAGDAKRPHRVAPMLNGCHSEPSEGAHPQPFLIMRLTT